MKKEQNVRYPLHVGTSSGLAVDLPLVPFVHHSSAA